MNQFLTIYKLFFHSLNIILISFYLFPGSILGWFLYDDLNKQPRITSDFKIDFIRISSNHFYVFFILSLLGVLSYLKDKKFNLLAIYLLTISIILELFHILIPERSFQFEDLFGNILGVVTVLIIYKIWKKYYEFI
tara:strand:- start:274 stop:681 length:408 start_codon:yes stop_codon:yes gene_type:complete